MREASALHLNQRAAVASQALPQLLVEAERIAATVMQGVHGRKRTGPGEAFWQYRPYSFGDSTSRIDWRKSARSTQVHIRENEWEAANTLWLWANPTASMDFKSHLAPVSKRDRGYLIALALASLAIRAQERVGLMASPSRPGHARGALEPMASWLMQNKGTRLPEPQPLQRFSTAVLISDFFEDPSAIEYAVRKLASRGVSGHLVQIIDPAEETLPYQGRIEFRDMEGPTRFLVGKTQNLREAYRLKFQEHREAVKTMANRLRWSFTVHHTDQSPTRLLMALHGRIGGAKSRALDIAVAL